MRKAKSLIMICFIFSMLSLMGKSAVSAQSDSTKVIRYSPDFSFNDGLFLDFDQVRSNKPVPKAKVVTTTDINSSDFFDVVIATKRIVYFDNLGIRHELSADKVWGYSRYGVLYINIGGIFNRINIVGSICHFIATVRTYQPVFADPFGSGGAFGGMGGASYMRSGGYESTEIKQLILDFETGKLYEYSLESLESLLIRDAELYSEFSVLKKRKKKQLKFVYLRKYNEKHPLYFTVQ